MSKRAALILFFVVCLFAFDGCLADTAPDITDRADIVLPGKRRKPADILVDGNYRTEWESSKNQPYVEFVLPDDCPCYGLYVQFGGQKPEACVQVPDGDAWKTEVPAFEVLSSQYIPLDGLTHFRLKASRETLRVMEVRLYGPGEVPQDVCLFEPAPEKADLLVMACHMDDELLWYGGLLPTYAGQLNMNVQVAYMTTRFSYRKCEALDGLWHCGVRSLPIFVGLSDNSTLSYTGCVKAWKGFNATARRIARIIRTCRPEVVVTQDAKGEYGHHQHVLMTNACRYALTLAADPNERSLRDLPPWQVKKCYTHLGKNDPLILDFDRPLSAFGGKTGMDIAREAFRMHVSQQTGRYTVEDSGPYDCRKYGLLYSSVGPDIRHDGLFENIPELYGREQEFYGADPGEAR